MNVNKVQIHILFMFLASTAHPNLAKFKPSSSTNGYNAQISVVLHWVHKVVAQMLVITENVQELSQSMAALPGLLGAGSLVYFHLLSHRELDIHLVKCICSLITR